MRYEQIKTTSWVTTLDELRIDYKRIQKLLRSQQIEKLRQENDALAGELNVGAGNVILIANNKIFKAYDINADELKGMFP